MKRSLLFSISLFCAVSIAQAFTLTSENLWEIETCWRGIFDEQWNDDADKTKNVDQLERYKKHMLAISDDDVQMAGQLIVRLCAGNLWDAFIEQKDKDAILAYLEMLTTALNGYIDPSCRISFPPKLPEIAENVRTSKLSEVAFCTKLRRAFLAFTIIVSKMDYIARQ